MTLSPQVEAMLAGQRVWITGYTPPGCMEAGQLAAHMLGIPGRHDKPTPSKGAKKFSARSKPETIAKHIKEVFTRHWWSNGVTFNELMGVLYGKPGSELISTNAEEAIWALVEAGELEYTQDVPAAFRRVKAEQPEELPEEEEDPPDLVPEMTPEWLRKGWPDPEEARYPGALLSVAMENERKEILADAKLWSEGELEGFDPRSYRHDAVMMMIKSGELDEMGMPPKLPRPPRPPRAAKPKPRKPKPRPPKNPPKPRPPRPPRRPRNATPTEPTEPEPKQATLIAIDGGRAKMPKAPKVRGAKEMSKDLKELWAGEFSDEEKHTIAELAARFNHHEREADRVFKKLLKAVEG